MIFGTLKKLDERPKRFSLGAASAVYENNELDIETITTVKLIQFLYHTLDRQLIAGLERGLGISAPHKRNIRRLIAQTADQNLTLTAILRPIGRATHNVNYSIFCRVCEVAAHCQNPQTSFLRRLNSIGQALSLSEDEISHHLRKNKIADN